MRGELTFDVAADVGGRLVLVGAADGGLRPAAWTSLDGVAWVRAPDGPAIAQPGSTGEIRDVVTLPGGGYAASGSLDGLPALWASPDGLACEQVAMSPRSRRELRSVGSSTLTSLVVRGDRLVLAGNDLDRRRAVFLTAELPATVAPRVRR